MHHVLQEGAFRRGRSETSGWGHGRGATRVARPRRVFRHVPREPALLDLFPRQPRPFRERTDRQTPLVHSPPGRCHTNHEPPTFPMWTR